MDSHIAFIGAGNMARAIISGLIAAKLPVDKMIAVNRSIEKNNQLRADFAINTSINSIEAVQNADVVVLGVKPQNMAELLSGLQDIDWQNKLVITIAAGMTIARYNTLTNCDLRIIRVMPNTASFIGEGMSGMFASQLVTQKDKDFAENLFKAIGKTCWVEKEDDINGVIAAAGSSPAYFFLFMQAMEEEAQRLGFSKDQSRTLIQQAAFGAAKMAIENTDQSFNELRLQVTSKGGATAEAIKIFEQAQLPDTVAKAMQAAVNRAKEMESLF